MLQQTKRKLVLVVLPIAVIVFLLGALLFVNQRSFVLGAVRVQGAVDLLVKRDGRTYPEIQFTDRKGVPQVISTIPKSLFFSPEPGDIVNLLYDLSNPTNVKRDSFVSIWLYPVGFLLLGVLLFIIGFVGLDAMAVIRDFLHGSALELEGFPPPPPGGQAAPQRGSPVIQMDAGPSQRQVDSPSASGVSMSAKRDPTRVEIERMRNDKNLFGILKQFVDDDTISDIIVTDHQSISVRRGGKTYNTSVVFNSEDSYHALLDRLLLAAGVTYSTAKPIVDGMIGSNIRIHAVNTAICEGGPYLTIRISRFSVVGLSDLAEKGMAPAEVFEYLRAAVICGQTVLVAGEVGTGKTTLARALCACVSQGESMLVIEDTPEIKVDHPHVRYMRTREANIAGAGRILPSECIRAGMRMAMNRIIFGEIRDSEAAEAFIDVCQSGHPGISTLHARSAADAMNRLELFLARQQHGVSRAAIKEEVATALQIIVYLKTCNKTGKRRVWDIVETIPGMNDSIIMRPVFNYRYAGNQAKWDVKAHTSLFEDSLAHGGFVGLLNRFPDKIIMPPGT